MQITTTTDLLLTKEFWILGVTSGILANLLVMLLWRGRRLVMLGIQLGVAHKKGYLKAREEFADSMARRQNVDILSFLVLHHFANSLLSLIPVVAGGYFFSAALDSEGYVRLILAPLAILFNLWAIMFTISWWQKYSLSAYAMSRVLRGTMGSGPAETPQDDSGTGGPMAAPNDSNCPPPP